jgi:hypothetical protein
LLWASSQVQELSIEYQRCTLDATNEFTTIPSDLVSSHFKNATTPSQAPQWRTFNQQIPYHNGAVTVDTPVCQLRFWIPDDLPAPVLLYYQLTNFYQNHRRYVKSLSSDQLKGNFVDNDTISNSDCDPLRLDDSGKAYYPCGLIANSLFNDSFVTPRLLNGRDDDTPINYTMTNKGIAWSSDGALYKNTVYTVDQVSPPPNWRVMYPEYSNDIPIPNVHDWEEFHVWMRTAGLPSFSKLALRNDTATMRSGQYEMEIYDCKLCYLAIFYCLLTKLSRLPCHYLRRHKIHPSEYPYHHGWSQSVPRNCIHCGRRCLHCSGSSLHGNPPDQAKVRYSSIYFAICILTPTRKLGDHTYLSWNNEQPSTGIATGRA